MTETKPRHYKPVRVGPCGEILSSHGHFPNKPVMPGVLTLECAGQTAAAKETGITVLSPEDSSFKPQKPSARGPLAPPLPHG